MGLGILPQLLSVGKPLVTRERHAAALGSKARLAFAGHPALGLGGELVGPVEVCEKGGVLIDGLGCGAHLGVPRFGATAHGLGHDDAGAEDREHHERDEGDQLRLLQRPPSLMPKEDRQPDEDRHQPVLERHAGLQCVSREKGNRPAHSKCSADHGRNGVDVVTGSHRVVSYRE